MVGCSRMNHTRYTRTHVECDMADAALSLTGLDESLPDAVAAASLPAPVKSLQDLCLDLCLAGRNLDHILFQSATGVPLAEWPETLVLKLTGLILLQQRLTPGIARALLNSDHDAIDALFAHFNINVMASTSVSTPRTWHHVRACCLASLVSLMMAFRAHAHICRVQIVDLEPLVPSRSCVVMPGSNRCRSGWHCEVMMHRAPRHQTRVRLH